MGYVRPEIMDIRIYFKLGFASSSRRFEGSNEKPFTLYWRIRLVSELACFVCHAQMSSHSSNAIVCDLDMATLF